MKCFCGKNHTKQKLQTLQINGKTVAVKILRSPCIDEVCALAVQGANKTIKRKRR